MAKFEFALDSERSFYEVEAATEAEARALLFADPDEYYTGCHHDTVDDANSYELIDVEGEIERPPVPADWPVQPIPAPERDQRAADGECIATCEECGRSWDDETPTSMTPTPGGRCPFEAFH